MGVDWVSLGTTGLAALLHVRYFDSAGRVYNVSAGLPESWSDGNYANYKYAPVGPDAITELGASGRYQWTTPTAVANWPSYTFEVHRTVGGTPATDPLVGEGPTEGITSGAATSVQGGASLPATRKLWAVLKTTGGAAYDPPGNAVYLRDPSQAFGVRRQDNQAVVVGISPLQQYTREAAGVYSYTLAETGLAYEYGIEFTNAAGVVERSLAVSAVDGVYFAGRADVEAEAGSENVTTYASWSNKKSDAEVAAQVDYCLRVTFAQMNGRIRAAGFAIPLTARVGQTLPADELREIHAKLAAAKLMKARDAAQPIASEERSDMETREQSAWRQLRMLILNGLSAAVRVTPGSAPSPVAVTDRLLASSGLVNTFTRPRACNWLY